MNCLIIEDDQRKADAYKAILDRVFGSQEWPAETCFNGAMHALNRRNYDVILLDITLPCFTSPALGEEHSMNLGGRDIMREIEIMSPDTKVIVITQFRNFGEMLGGVSFEDLRKELKSICPECYYDMIQFHFDSDDWGYELETKLNLIRDENSNNR